MRLSVRHYSALLLATYLVTTAQLTSAYADTLEAALGRAYRDNPQLNAQRALVRSTDENVPQALSNYRPKVNLTGSAGYRYRDVLYSNEGAVSRFRESVPPSSVKLTVSQILSNGRQTANKTRAADKQVLRARQALRSLEQSVLLSAVTAYMDYLRDSASLAVQTANVRVLEQGARQAYDRFRIGEITYTDVAQSEAQLAAGRAQEQAAVSQLTASQANFHRYIGGDPIDLAPASPVDHLLPKILSAATEMALVEDPDIQAAMYGIDVSHLQILINEGALSPTVTLQASAQQQFYEQSSTSSYYKSFSGAAAVQASVPLYQGGSEHADIRQSKEALTQQQLTLERTRAQVRATVAQRWGELDTARAKVRSAQTQVAATETAMDGVRDEAMVGQRTTLDVLNAQQALVNARISLVTAQHDRIIASYNVLGAIGRLSPQVLNLQTSIYDPSVHYKLIRDSWGETQTP
ncbi:TolC family outer membrane protein [Bradyrhizobium liaoningense]|uniref:TolC family outer membrane protein n=1 Tax=Bradyrhizobium liaoningense TaxID=43992 RepID=UPI001BA93111|nr:TolC family outer membrane protein [Bradyrhizobium liaoningense]